MRNYKQVRVLIFAALVMLMTMASASAQVAVSISFGPPALPIYEQPVCPGENYLWTPGYWAFDNDFDDYYWVPGTWVLAPQPGLYWTPGYWAWNNGGFFFNEGYWAPEVGFYGGIAYGFGYFGDGYAGGRWDNGRFFYNRAVTNVNTTIIHNVYNTTIINRNVTRVSYNGGNGGINARPTSRQEEVARERHVAPIEAQNRNRQAARSERDLRASVNQGKPPIAATPSPGKFNDREVVRAKEAGAPYHPPANRGQERQAGRADRPNDNNANQRSQNDNQRPPNVVHPRDLPPAEHRAAPNTGDAKRDQRAQRDQEKFQTRQQQERQKLEQRQERDDQKLQQKRADDAARQQMEQRHQQQTQQLEQKHAQQQQKLERKQPPERRSDNRTQKQDRPDRPN